MVTLYPAIYRDQYGEEQITIETTGTSLRMVIRGVEFTGTDFESLRPIYDPASQEIKPFVFSYGCLTHCSFECQIPITLVVDDKPMQTMLLAQGGIGAFGEGLILQLYYENQSLKSTGRGYGYFENELFDIHKRLPQDSYMKICAYCAFANYNPAGNGMFGCLACFRDNKEGIRAVRDKSDLFKIWDTMTEFVQETHLCPEFEKRQN